VNSCQGVSLSLRLGKGRIRLRPLLLEDRLVIVAGFTGNIDSLSAIQQHPYALAAVALVVGDQNTDRLYASILLVLGLW
jgi:hypothetical protein